MWNVLFTIIWLFTITIIRGLLGFYSMKLRRIYFSISDILNSVSCKHVHVRNIYHYSNYAHIIHRLACSLQKPVFIERSRHLLIKNKNWREQCLLTYNVASDSPQLCLRHRHTIVGKARFCVYLKCEKAIDNGRPACRRFSIPNSAMLGFQTSFSFHAIIPLILFPLWCQ
jgi:hypothetical protein